MYGSKQFEISQAIALLEESGILDDICKKRIEKAKQSVDEEDFVAKMVREKKERKEYFVSTLNEDLANLVDWMKSNDMDEFCTDGVYYFENERTDYERILKKIFEALMECVPSNPWNVYYGGCKFTLEHGQGSLYIIEIL